MPRFLIAPTGHSMPLADGETCVGSDPSVQIPVRADLGLLPRHFVIAQLESGWHLGAYDGAAVWVNGQPVRVTALHDGDRIVAGQLELTYRDEPEVLAAPAGSSMRALSLPTLQMGTALLNGGGGAVPLPPMTGEEAPARASMPMPAYTSLRLPNASRAGEVGWSPGRTALIGGMLVVLGSLACYAALFDWPEPLKNEDVVIHEAQILSATQHTPRKGLSWTEVKVDPPMNRTIELPDDLPFKAAWGRSVVRIGFEKKLLEDTRLNSAGKLVPLKVVTLEVDGRSYRSLTMHNTLQEADRQLFLLAGPIMLLVGLVLLKMAWEKWKVKRRARLDDPGDAGEYEGGALAAVPRGT